MNDLCDCLYEQYVLVFYVILWSAHKSVVFLVVLLFSGAMVCKWELITENCAV